MRISTFLSSIKQGFQNMRRNKLFSLASIGTIAACIFLMGIFYSILTNFTHMVQKAQEQVAITVFFDKGLDQASIDKIGEQIKQHGNVHELTFTSAEEAWNNFKKEYFKDHMEAAAGFEDDNPLANSASYTIKLEEASGQDEMVKFLKGLDGVRQVNYSKTTADAISDFARLVGYISIVIIVILLGVGIFLISNTIMIGISVRKEEIGIMKLIGATDYFVRSPFIVEGVLIGLIGAAIPLIAIYFIYSNVIELVLVRFTGISGYIDFLPVGSVFKILVPAGLLIGAGIGYIGSRLSIRKHLKI